MTSFALPSLSTLQASLQASLAGLAASDAGNALNALRQVPALSELSSLDELVSQDHLARMVFKPSLHAEVAGRLNVFNDLPALRTLMALPSIGQRLGGAAAALDLRHGVQVYGAMFVFNERPSELSTLQKSMSRALKDELNWPHSLTLESLGSFAASVRKCFTAHGDHLSAEQRHDLMQIAARLDEAALSLCAFDPAQALSPIHARKLAVLMDVLYGCGFGDDTWEDASAPLHRLTRQWNKTDAGAREAALRNGTERAKALNEGAQQAYRDLLGPINAVPDFRLTGAIAALARHLEPGPA